MDAETKSETRSVHQRIGLWLGLSIFAVFVILPAPSSMSPEAWRVAGMASLMGVWWASEAIPIPATALLPLALLPLLGVADVKAVATSFSSATIYLLLGGFILALGLQRWNLHRRIALTILSRMGDRPALIVGGFMLTTALLSMWVSNTASTIMMLPIALSVAGVIAPNHANDRNQHNFVIAVVLGIAYSASIGGLGTLIGTPPNLLVAGYMEETHNIQITFTEWLVFGIPLVVVMLPLTWFVLIRFACRFHLPRNEEAGAMIRDSLREMGRLSATERRMALIFVLVALSWSFRPMLNRAPGLDALSDTGIAILGALALFVVPSGKGGALMNWDWAKRLPWDVLLLYGGGMALASAVTTSGLSVWLGDRLAYFTSWPLLGLIAVVVVVVIFLTELTNNSATVAAFLPVLGALALQGQYPVMFLAVPLAMAASCAFMLPVATPPNAIVYGSGSVTLPEMAKAGILLNIAGIVIIPLLAYLLLPILYGE